jgi:hypothetical protein
MQKLSVVYQQYEEFSATAADVVQAALVEGHPIMEALAMVGAKGLNDLHLIDTERAVAFLGWDTYAQSHEIMYQERFPEAPETKCYVL